jgi:hypothetical protein
MEVTASRYRDVVALRGVGFTCSGGRGNLRGRGGVLCCEAVKFSPPTGSPLRKDQRMLVLLLVAAGAVFVVRVAMSLVRRGHR